MPRRVIIELEEPRVGTGTLRALLSERVVSATGEGPSFADGAELAFSHLENLQRTAGSAVPTFTERGEPRTGLIAAEVGEAVLPEVTSLGTVRRVWQNPAIEPCSFMVAAPDSECSYDAVGTSVDVVARLGVEEVWKAGLRGEGVAIAICDNGVDSETFEVIDGWSPLPSSPWGQEQVGWVKGHGTMCAHAALLSAPEAKILDVGILKYPNKSRNAWLSNAILGFNWIAQWSANNPEYRVLISNSWSSYRSLETDDQTGSYRGSQDHPFNRRTSTLASQGFPIFFAAGNCGNPCPDLRCGASDRGPGRSIWGASSLESVVCVAAVDIDCNRIGYSSQGPGVFHASKPDLSAFAQFKGYTSVDAGTSTAAPVGVGAAAVLLSNRDFEWEAVRSALTTSARKSSSNGWDTDLG